MKIRKKTKLKPKQRRKYSRDEISVIVKEEIEKAKQQLGYAIGADCEESILRECRQETTLPRVGFSVSPPPGVDSGPYVSSVKIQNSKE